MDCTQTGKIPYFNSARVVALSEGMKKGIISTGYNPTNVLLFLIVVI